MYALSAVVYAERGDEILLLKRAEGTALAGQFFLPGGLVEPSELPEDGGRRELAEEAGIEIDGELELVGWYPIFVYGYDMLQLPYRGRVADGAAVAISHEHDDQQWADPAELRALFTNDVIEAIAAGDDRVRDLVRGVRTDLDRYLRRVVRLHRSDQSRKRQNGWPAGSSITRTRSRGW
jgi:8-oxo-dGTP pyrophosphatase MutT (NUDIX family)